MKNLGKLKLNELSKMEMEKREMSNLRGGLTCGCGCAAEPGDYQVILANQNANAESGYGSPGGNYVCWYWNPNELMWESVATK